MTGASPDAARRVLIVDDDADVLHNVATALSRSLGCAIEPFTRGSDAVDRAHKVGFDAAILDYDMPDLDGIALARALRTIQPSLPILFLTGSTPDFAPDDLAAIAPRAVLAKPVTPAELSAHVRDIFAE